MKDESLKDLAGYIQSAIKIADARADVVRDEIVLHVQKDQIKQALSFLINDANCEFTMLLDICGVDYPDRTARFEVVYHLLSLKHNHRLRVKIAVEEEAIVDSVTSLFASAGWYEREVWDMYGVAFAGNADLRRILTDYGFEGHPLRKDFPLTGYVEVRYDEEQRRVVYEPVKLAQDFRTFDFISPWEGMTDVQLSGDEKAVKPKVIAGKGDQS